LLAAGSVAAACGLLLYRLVPDVDGKPLYEDEAISGLIAMRPLPEVLDTVVLDRGGAPAHFVLAHVAFGLDMSYASLRWLSVLVAVASVPLAFDLGRRLAGAWAGVVSAAVVASSTALAVYGSFGRMYALFVFAAALFGDLYVRALDRPTTWTIAAASAAGWLLPAVHPYGAIPAFVALVAAALRWRRRSLRPAIPVLIAVLAAIPFVLADLRLAERSSVGTGGTHALASPGEAWDELVAALSAFAGGDGVFLVFFTLLAVAGIWLLLRERPAVAAVALSTAIPPLLFVLVRTGSNPDLSPRHLFYGLPLWAAAIGVAAARLPVVAAVAIAVLALAAPASALRDPRGLGAASSPISERHAIRAGPNDLLIPYASVYLRELPADHRALALPHARGDDILRTLEHAEEPIGAVYVAIPTEPWTVRRLEGPFDKPGALNAAAVALAGADHPPELRRWFAWIEPGLCEALRELSRPCP
jgi:hypothetical protein